MAKNIFVGVNGVARKAKNIYVGVNGVARKVKAAYVGVNGVARKVWPNSRIPDESYQEVEYIPGLYNFNTGVNAATTPRVLMGVMFTADFNNSYYRMVSSIYSTALSGGGDGSYIDVGYDFYRPSTKRFTSQTHYNRYDTDRYLYSNNDEKTLFNKKYLFDINNNGNLYIYNESGFYSISSNNLIGAMSITSYTEQGPVSPYNSKVIIGPSSSNAIGRTNVRYYEIQMYNGSTLIRNLIPCKNTSNILGYYDLANRIFYSAGISYDPDTNTPPIV